MATLADPSATSEDFLAEKIAENKHILILFLCEMWCENLSRKSECSQGISTSWGPSMLIALMLSPVQLFVTPRTAACQAPLSLRLSWEVYWSGLPFFPPVDLPNSGTEPTSLTSALQVDSFITELLEKPWCAYSVQFSSVAQCPAFCDPMNLSTPGLPVHHHLPEFT